MCVKLKMPALDPFLAAKSLLEWSPVQTIFDIGAYTGEYTEHFLFHFPSAQVYAFEPTPTSFDRLARRFRGHHRVYPFHLAPADYEGTGKFFMNTAPETNSLLPAEAQGDMWADTPGNLVLRDVTHVPVTTLYRFCDQHGIPHIDILKIDTQGADLMVLRGGEGLLARGDVKVILVELIFAPIYEGQASVLSIWAFLDQFEYRLYNLFGLNRAPNGRLKWCDGLFVHKRFLDQGKSG